MTMHASLPPGAITYEQYLRNQAARPHVDCGPPVVDDRPWWQHLPVLNPYAELEQQVRESRRHTRADPEAGQ